MVLPPGYDCYLRLFHPFVRRGAESADRRPVEHGSSWRELARQAQVPYAATLTVRQLGPALPGEGWEDCPWELWEGELEEGVAKALFGTLAEHSTEPYFFAFGLAAVIAGTDHRPLLFSAPSLDDRQAAIDEVREAGAGYLLEGVLSRSASG